MLPENEYFVDIYSRELVNVPNKVLLAVAVYEGALESLEIDEKICKLLCRPRLYKEFETAFVDRLNEIIK